MRGFMEATLVSLGLYPVVERRIMGKEEFDRLVDMAKVELANTAAEPYLRL